MKRLALHFGGGYVFTTYPSTSHVIGNAQKFNHGKDIELIGSPVGSYAGSIYSGAYNSSTSVSISGHDTAIVDDYVCMEGGFTGGVCSNLVTKVNQSVNYGVQQVPSFGQAEVLGTDVLIELDPHVPLAIMEGDRPIPAVLEAPQIPGTA